MEKKNIIFDYSICIKPMIELITSMKLKIQKTIKFLTPSEEIKLKKFKNIELFNFEGFNLNLTYISERIIAMCFPKKELVDDLNRLFTERHNNKVKVYNLCLEFPFEGEIFNQQKHYPFNDREVPALHTVLEFCEDLDQWLNQDKENIGVVHCKAGMGRTGMFIVCYMIYKKFIIEPEHAIYYFRNMRTNDGIALRNPSQIRYIKYFHSLLPIENIDLITTEQSSKIKTKKYKFNKLILQNFSESIYEQLNENKIKFELHINNYCDEKHVIPITRINNEKIYTAQSNENDIILNGDVKICIVKIDLFTSEIETACYLFINTFFVNEELPCLKFDKAQIDKAFRDYENKIFKENFEIEIILENF